MTSIQYRNLLTKFGLSIVGAAPVFGISRRQAQRIASGSSPVPEPIAKLLRLMVSRNLKPEDVK